MSAAAAISVSEMSREERVRLAYQAGRLRYKVAPHHIGLYDSFERWNQKRQTRSYLDWCASIGAQFDNMFMLRCARRTRKTTWCLIKAVEEAIRYANAHGAGARGMICIPVQKKIGGVIVPLTKVIFRDAPKGYFPEWMGSSEGEHEHLYVPAVEARIRLVGIDHHPDALRGSYLDYFIGTEIGFAKPGFHKAYCDDIQLQFQGRPWAWSIIESSEPEVIDHDFNLHFKLDAQARGCFFSQTIRDNTTLTEEEIQDEIRRSGGPDSATTKRELFNIQEADPETQVIPHFDEEVHVLEAAEYNRPAHALAYEGYDPGTTDPLGYVAGHLNWERQQFVVEYAFMRPGMSTGEFVDEQVRPVERALWGTELETFTGRQDKRDEGLPVLLQRIADAQELYDGSVWEAPYGSLTYWDKASWSLKANPICRVSDTHARFIIDLNKDYALSVVAAEKEPGSAESDLAYLDELFRRRHDDGRPMIVILRNGKTDQLIQQLRSGRWRMRDDVHKIDFERSKLLGHLDCMSALKYLVRRISWTRNPNPPAIRDVHRNNLHVPPELMPEHAKAPQPIAAHAGPRMSLGARMGLQPQGPRPRFR